MNNFAFEFIYSFLIRITLLFDFHIIKFIN